MNSAQKQISVGKSILKKLMMIIIAELFSFISQTYLEISFLFQVKLIQSSQMCLSASSMLSQMPACPYFGSSEQFVHFACLVQTLAVEQ